MGVSGYKQINNLKTSLMNILIVSNCNTIGLKNCFEYFAPQLQIDAFDINQAKKLFLRQADVGQYDNIIAMADFFRHLNFPVRQSGKEKIVLHPFVFSAFHPDICYLIHNGNFLKSSMDDYNSILVFAGFMHNAHVDTIYKLFNHEVFEKLGYFEFWNRVSKHLTRSYNFLSVDVAQWLQQRSGNHDCFMYNINHPKIFMLSDLTQFLLDYMNIPYCKQSEPPIPDNLALGPVWPVYPDIALHYGFTGNYRFRPQAEEGFKTFGLMHYIENSLSIYQQAGREQITIFNDHNFNRVQRCVDLIGELL